MYDVKSLEYTIRELYRAGKDAYDTRELEKMLNQLSFEDLLQGVRDNAETVHAYVTQGITPMSFNYRGRELFEGQRATCLYEECDQSTVGSVLATRTYELWLLEDMNLAVVVCVCVRYKNGAYDTEYREVKGGDPSETGLYPDLEKLTDALLELSAASFEHEQPVYEL